MHEYAVVQQLVQRLLDALPAQDAQRVRQVHLRRGSTFSDGSLRQAFQLLTEETPLKGAELVVEEFSVQHRCGSCGHLYVVVAEDLLGHLSICPNCGALQEISEAQGLELLEVTLEGDDGVVSHYKPRAASPEGEEEG